MKGLAYVVVALILFVFSSSVLASSCCASRNTAPGTDAPQNKPPGTVKATAEQKSVSNPMVVLETNYGNITLELFKKEAPISVDNFLSYVEDGFYDGTVFHRVVKGFVLQAGGMDKDMKQKKQKDPIKNEATNGLSNKRGTISMARTSAINSATSHFFINLVDNTRLDHTGQEAATYGYAVFGRVADGMDVVDKIAQVQVTNKGQFKNVPVKPVTIKKARIVDQGKTTKKVVEKKLQKEAKTEKKMEEKKIKEE